MDEIREQSERFAKIWLAFEASDGRLDPAKRGARLVELFEFAMCCSAYATISGCGRSGLFKHSAGRTTTQREFQNEMRARIERLIKGDPAPETEQTVMFHPDRDNPNYGWTCYRGLDGTITPIDYVRAPRPEERV